MFPTFTTLGKSEIIMSALLETKALTKRYGDCVSVSEVSLDFKPGLIHAVLGENGAGKSTLMKLLFGLVKPTSGEIFLNGKVVHWRSPMDAIEHGLGMVQQHFTLVETLSAIDNITIGAEVSSLGGVLDRDAEIKRLESLLPSTSLAVPWHALVRDLTVGQKQRIEILKLLFREAKILFLDEPTAVLTPSEIEDFFSVLRQLKASGRTIILITHKIGEVLSVCDTYTILRQGKLIDRGVVPREARGDLGDKIVESMIGRKLQEASFDRTPVSARAIFSCENLASVEGGGRGGVNGISVRVAVGEVVGIAGVEGSGQSQFVDMLMGLREFSGTLQIAGENIDRRKYATRHVRDLGVALVPEDRLSQGLWLEESCFSNMMIGLEDRFIKNGRFDDSQLQKETSKWAQVFDVRAASLSIPVGGLSGGNQQKVIFAREVAGRKPKFLVCHQPTRGVDLGAIDLIHRKIMMLRNEGLGVLVISSELDELLKLCDRLYVFFEGKVAAQFERKDFDRLRVGAAMTGVDHVQ